MASNQASIWLDRDLLRHKSVQMTERYVHLAPHNVRSAVETLDGMAISVSIET